MMISVIIPMYNSKDTIVRALDSVKNQTLRCEYEVMVINDGSKDDSQSIVEQYIQENPDFNVILINQENGGVSKARNTGLRLAKGDFIAFLDSDDAWFSDKLENQISLINQNPEIDFIGCAFDNLYLKNFPDGELLKINVSKLIFRNYFQPSTVVMKREIVNSIGYFDENQKYAEEGNYFIRIANQFNCFFWNKIVINYGDGKSGFGASGLSANIKEMHKGFNKNLKYAYDNNLINLKQYVFSSIFEKIKYFRRLLIVRFK